MKNLLLFVYGTMKSSQKNNFRLDNAEFLGSASTKPKYDIEFVKDSPNITRGNSIVKGELYKVPLPVVRELDKFEKPYKRFEVELLDGRTAEAYWLM